MIGRLSGKLVERRPPWLVIDCAGVGYEVEAPLGVFDRLPETGGEVVLLIHHVVREDAQLLFGFGSHEDRELFRSLLKISGIGPKVALNILSAVGASDFALLVESGDAQALTRLPGIGKKTAERLIVEMRGRLDQWAESATSAPAGGGDALAEARAGLVALGYSPAEALKMAREAGAPGLGPEAIIRAALKARVSR